MANIEDKRHLAQIKKLNIFEIELVLSTYPFEETKTTSTNICIENIDIGGPSLIRAAAKNYLSTVIVVDNEDYKKVVEDIKKYGGVSIELRKF